MLQRWVAVEAALAKAYIPLWFSINTIRAEVLNSETLLLYWPSPFKEVPVLRVNLSLNLSFPTFSNFFFLLP